MREWLSSLTIARVPEVALALALGYTLANLADRVARIPASVVEQHIGSFPFGTIGDTVIAYGEVLVTMLALGLIGVVALVVVRLRDRELDACPFCASLIPRESRHCAYCGSGVEAGEPRASATPVELG